MPKSLEKAYNPKMVESSIYKTWEKSKFFNPDKLPGKRNKVFNIAMPPPNVTGDLHLGHATGMTIEDILIRWRRMQGHKTLWLPGTDHAGISTQIMVEKVIAKEGLDRHALGHDKFLRRVWEWKKKYGTKITEQIRQIGASCDWSREHFTMDKNLTRAVQEAFITMFNDGLIYRGNRIINWCPRCASAISDLEVKHIETSGKLWYLKYPIFGSTKYIIVATTRPETMLGDTAVAVHPKDKRYTNYVGKTVLLPIMDREIPIIADGRVDMNFGTGAVKVTPAHDHLDYEIGQKHHLDIVNVIGQNGQMTKEVKEFYGQSIQKARYNILERLKEEGLIEKTIDYKYNQARCDRCSTPVEPLISEQWFVKIAPLAKPAIEAVKKGKIKIIPERFNKIYYHWMENIRDWCISRQLWWGHQIPVWYCLDCKKASATIKSPKKCPGCQSKKFKQETDTFDTWFSSGLWTFSTLGWPEKTKDLKTYHPTSVMETGWDILFFWVARMIMMSLYFMKEVPFKTVYLHGLVLDRQGKKMSKSKGTGVDPIPMTEKYGTDAIRLSLVLGSAAGQDFRLYEEKIAGYRNFINKLWNISRYILSQDKIRTAKVPEIKTLADKWVVSRANQLVQEVTEHLEKFQFSEAGTKIYEFAWHEFADWYLEISKTEKNLSVLSYILERVLLLLHPFTPFVTEEIWSRWHGGGKKNLLMIQEWPTINKKLIDKEAEKAFSLIRDFVVGIRNFKAEHKMQVNQKLNVWYWGPKSKLIKENTDSLGRLAFANLIESKKTENKKITGSLNGLDYHITKTKDDRMTKKEIEKISQYIQRLETKLSNKNFVKNAPPEIVEKEKEKLKEQQERLKKLL